MDLKQSVIRELRELMQKENLNVNDLLAMLEYASTIELCVFRNNVKRLLLQWKERKGRSSKARSVA